MATKQAVIKFYMERENLPVYKDSDGIITRVEELDDEGLACLLMIRYFTWFTMLETRKYRIATKDQIEKAIRLSIRLMRFPNVPHERYFHETALLYEAMKRVEMCTSFNQLCLMPNVIKMVGNEELRLFIMQKLRRWHNQHMLRNNEFIQHRLILEHAFVLVGGQDTLDTGELGPDDLQSEALARSLRRTKNLANF